MELITILNRGFVYQRAHFSADKKSLPKIFSNESSFEGWLFLGHRGSPLSFLVVKLNEPFDWFERRDNTYPVFAPCSHHEKNAVTLCAEVEIALLPFDKSPFQGLLGH